MKKTLTINLSGIVFNIDEDAYTILHDYLQKLEVRFSDEEQREILCDIEARLAELFSNSFKYSKYSVITINEVNSAIEQLGTAEEISNKEDETNNSSQSENTENRRRHRKFYRDADNKILGGVAAGLAAYLGFETTITRLILLLLAITIFSGWLIPIYFIVWLIAPEAITTAQKLEMQGIEPSIENIKNYLNSEQFKDSASRVGSRLGEIIKWLFRIAAIFIGIFFALIGIIVIGILTFTLIAIITGMGSIIFGGILPLTSTNTLFITFITSSLIAILIPIVAIIITTIRLIRNDKNSNKSKWGWMWFIIWIIASLISLSTLIANVPQLSKLLNNFNENDFTTLIDSNITTEERLRNEIYNRIEIGNALNVILVEDTCSFIEVKGNAYSLRNIKTSIEDNTLKLKLTQPINTLNDKNSITIHYSSEINEIEMTSASVISNENNSLKSNGLEIDASTASVINLNVECAKLDIEASSAAVINITGKANYLTSELSSAAIVNFKELIVDSAYIEASSGAIIDAPKTPNITINNNSGAIINK